MTNSYWDNVNLCSRLWAVRCRVAPLASSSVRQLLLPADEVPRGLRQPHLPHLRRLHLARQAQTKNKKRPMLALPKQPMLMIFDSVKMSQFWVFLNLGGLWMNRDRQKLNWTLEKDSKQNWRNQNYRSDSLQKYLSTKPENSGVVKSKRFIF